MKSIYLLATTLLLLTAPLFGQHPLGIRQYPAVKHTAKPVVYNWSPIDALIEDGKPRAAKAAIEQLQQKAIADQNVSEYWRTLDRLTAIMQQGFEEESDRQQWMWEQSERADSLPFPLNNLLHFYISVWINDYDLTTNDESLNWKMGNKRVRIGEDRGQALQDYHEQRSLDRPEELMLWSIQSAHYTLSNYQQEDTVYWKQFFATVPTLFDYLADKYIERNRDDFQDYYYYRFEYDYRPDSQSFSDSLSFGPSDQLAASSDYKRITNWVLPLFEARELLAWNNNRLWAYTQVLNDRLQFVRTFYEGPGDASRHYFRACEQAEGLLLRKDDPASAVFTLILAGKLTEDGKNWHWKTNKEPQNALVKALQKVDYSLTKYPNSERANDLKALRKTITDSEAAFEIKSDLVRNKPQLLQVNYRNMTGAVVTVFKVKKHGNQETTANVLRSCELQQVLTQTIAFDADANMLPHSKDILLPGFSELGDYVVVLTESPAKLQEVLTADTLFKIHGFAYRFVQISQLAVKTKTLNDQTRLMVVDKITGKPIAGASIRFTRANYSMGERKVVTIGSAKTDKNGLADANYTGAFGYVVTYKGDSISDDHYAYYYRPETLKTRVEVYTDRGIYRPGQTVHFKCIAFSNLEGKQETVENFQVRLKTIDENDQQLASLTGRTNATGSWSGSFQLPLSGFLPGSIQLSINEGTAVQYIRVEEYKRPTFEIVTDTLKTGYALGDSITISGKVMALAGYGIGGAKVTIDISEQRFLPWGYRGTVKDYNQQVFAVTTDATGAFRITFPTEQSKDPFGISYQIAIEAVSTTGETQQAGDYLYVGKQRYSVYVDGGGDLIAGEPNHLNVRVINNDGVEQEKATVTYKLERQVPGHAFRQHIEPAEFSAFTAAQLRAAFPNMAYYESDKIVPYTFVKEGSLPASDSIALNALGLTPGTYRITCAVKDETGDTIRTMQYFNWINLKSAKNQHESALWMHQSATTSEPKKSVTLTIGSSLKKIPVFVEVYDNQQLLSTQWLTINGRGKVTVPVKENAQQLHFLVLAQHNGMSFAQSGVCNVMGVNEPLTIRLETKRDFLRPGTEETWSMTVSNPLPNASPAELMVNMYDASLDAFMGNYWNTQLFRQPYASHYWSYNADKGLRAQENYWNSPYYAAFGANSYFWRGGGKGSGRGFAEEEAYGAVYELRANAPMMDGLYESTAMYSVTASDVSGNSTRLTTALIAEQTRESDNTAVAKAHLRTNFNETAFFYPSVTIGADNTYRFTFTVPDALTRWRLMTLAHNKQLQTGYNEWSFASRKEIMVMPNVPRFYREGDVVEFAAQVSNLSDQATTAVTRLRFIDPYTEKDLSAAFGNPQAISSSINSKESATVSWTFTVPKGISLAAYVIETTAGAYSDGEQRPIPILSSKVQLTESKAFAQTTAGTGRYTLEKVAKLAPGSEKIGLKLELQTQPLWTTLMSLPYLMEYPHECAEQTFARYYGNILAQKILRDNPEFRRVVEAWKSDDPTTFVAQLEQHPELKAIILSETPWVMDAQNEREQRLRLAMLFDENTLEAGIRSALKKLENLRAPDGCWGWFGNENSNRYITQHILSGFAQLKDLGIETDAALITPALLELDRIYSKHYELLKADQRKKFSGLDEMTIDWLVLRRYFTSENEPEAVIYYRQCMEKQWKSYNLQTQASIGIDAVRSQNKTLSEKIRKSLLDRATRKPEMGMYWNENTYGYGWSQAIIETQSALIRFFHAAGNSEKEVRDMQLWLLQNKRTNAWETTKATTNACHALLIDKSTVAAQLNQTVRVTLGDGTNLGTIRNSSGYERSWSGNDITEGKATVQVETANDQPVFGSLYLTYLSEQSQVEKSNGDIRVERHLYRTVNNQLVAITAGEQVEAGTRLTVKVTVTANRALEFVYIRAPHAFGFEATEPLSGYRYGETPFYQVNRDAAAELFVDNLKKGTTSFSYEVFATGRGQLSVGPVTVECMYAPVFRANSSGTRITIN